MAELVELPSPEELWESFVEYYAGHVGSTLMADSTEDFDESNDEAWQEDYFDTWEFFKQEQVDYYKSEKRTWSLKELIRNLKSLNAKIKAEAKYIESPWNIVDRQYREQAEKAGAPIPKDYKYKVKSMDETDMLTPEELEKWYKQESNKQRVKFAFNDMLGKGWDSAAQFSFCIQESLKGNPQFWWVREVLSKFPHPPDWDHVSRNPDGAFRSFPGGKKSALQVGLQKFADALLEKGYQEESEQITDLLQE